MPAHLRVTFQVTTIIKTSWFLYSITLILKNSHIFHTEKCCIRYYDHLFVIPFPVTDSFVWSILRIAGSSSRICCCQWHLQFLIVTAAIQFRTLLSVGSGSLILLPQDYIILSSCLCPSFKWFVRLNFPTKMYIFSSSFLLHGICCYCLFHLIAGIITVVFFLFPYQSILYVSPASLSWKSFQIILFFILFPELEMTLRIHTAWWLE